MDLRVFVVEDLPNMRTLMNELFMAFGGVQMAGGAATEAEAILWLQENAGAWDLAIVDLVLEQGSGMNVVSRARHVHPEGRIAVFSSYATEGVRQHCLALGADAVFGKNETQAFLDWIDGLRGGEAGPSLPS